jgi:hypothetical protein
MDAEIIFERRSSMKINQLLESLNQQQRSVPQLPAQAKARHIKVLGAKTDPKHPFAGYMVGADESVEPGSKRIGPDRNDPWEKGWRAGFHHTESNPYPAGSKEAKQWDDGYAEAESQPNHYDESVTEVFSNDKETGTTHRGGVVAKTAKGIKHTNKLKARLGDYLGDLSKEIKKDPDLIDKLAAKAPDDQMGPPVKTVTTDDGHEIQIHGNEDDGFRVSIKNKTANSKFKNLDEAVMACEMYCARRRAQAKSADYVDEA